MSQSSPIPGFRPFLLIGALMAFIGMGHLVVILNIVARAFAGQDQLVLTVLVNGCKRVPDPPARMSPL